MSTLHSQRDLLATFKKETCFNVSILSKVYPMPLELSRQILKEDALEKPTQPVFMHLSYYLVCIIDPQKSSLLTWPLYDTVAERAYRTNLSNFVVDYCKLGLLTPVMSSYFVNPGCFKVVKLMFQLSQLAVQRALQTKIARPEQQKLYDDVTLKYKAGDKEDFVENMEKETKTMSNKFSLYLKNKKLTEEVAEIFRKKIVENERKVQEIKKNKLFESLVDSFLKTNILSTEIKLDIEKLKDVSKPCPILDIWLGYIDEEIAEMESKWDNKMTPFIEISKSCKETSEALIRRQTNEIDKKSYLIEYNPKTDYIDTKELEQKVNSEQKYILKNIIKDERLNFPNLIRGFVISICYILNSTQMVDDVYKFNECLENEKRNYGEVVEAVKILLNRVMEAEEKLQMTPTQLFNQSISIQGFSELPPLPDLSDLKCTRELLHTAFDSFTPLNVIKHNFNLRRRVNIPTFAKPKPLVTPFHTGPREDFLKTLISCRTMSLERPNTSHNISTISQAAQRVNETIAGCTSGFTKQQIQRLLSTKKGSSTKKNKFCSDRPNIKVVKGGLFNESNESALYRSHSSPNLFESRERRSKLRGRQLSVMQEDIPTLLEVSGISIIENNSGCTTPNTLLHLEESAKFINDANMPASTISPVEHIEEKLHYILQETENKVENTSTSVISIDGSTILKEKSMNKTAASQSRVDESFKTPQPASTSIRKTSSIEKIINRFKKVRASVVPEKREESNKDFQTILEEKENHMNPINVDVYSANRKLLPDLLSPNYTFLPKKSSDDVENMYFDDEMTSKRKPRESLGTALGVDHTFLDQFDLLD